MEKKILVDLTVEVVFIQYKAEVPSWVGTYLQWGVGQNDEVHSPVLSSSAKDLLKVQQGLLQLPAKSSVLAQHSSTC